MRLRCLCAPLGLVVFSVHSAAHAQNHSPDPPIITQPGMDGQIVNPADVHMETGPFSDPDPGDTHICTDWEIRTVTPDERIWFIPCVGGLERTHTHLGDGLFQNSHEGRASLLFETGYRLRVRHKDSSNDPATEWSPWSERLFRTGPPSEIFPLELSDIVETPTPAWVDQFGDDVILPGGATPPSLRIESGQSQPLLEFRGLDGKRNIVINPQPLTEHVPVRVRIDAGDTGQNLALPRSRLLFTDAQGLDRVVYLPPVNLQVTQRAFFWISAGGSTYVGDESQSEPDFSTLARGAPVPWEVTQPGFQVEVVAAGFRLPVNIAFVPNPGPDPGDPFYYVSELYGIIKVVARDGTVSDYATDLLNFSPTGNFPGSGEQGLTGIVVDRVSGDLFAAMLYDSAPPDGPHFPKVVRFHSADGGRTASSQTVILDMPGEQQGQSHQISNLTIGPDEKLYVHMGDGLDASTAQNLDSYRGKVLRINLDGTPPIDNPFYDAANGINARDYVFAYGLRNPFGGAWRAADGVHYEVENGPSIDRFAQVLAGRNYLWDGQDASMRNFAIYNWEPATGPVNIAFVEPQTWGGSGFPPEKMDHAFVSESGPTWASGPQSRGKRITEFVFDQSGNLIDGPTPLISYNGSGKATVVGLTVGPDGLYFTDLYKDLDYQSPIERGAQVLRVKYVGQADFVADVQFAPRPPLDVQFTDTSSVPAPTAWSWSFGDGARSDQRNPRHTYTREGLFNVRLSLTGENGVSVVQKNGFVRIGVFRRIAIIGGAIPPSPSDANIADHLRARSFEVEVFDDERGNRPSAAELAADFALVIISSTASSANIAGDFRDQPVPLLYWEQALNTIDRIPLAAGGTVVPQQTSISISENNHPVTAGLPLGMLDVFTTPADMSVASAPFGPDVSTLATRAADAALMVADSGAELLGGHRAPARRVFLFFEDQSWLSTTEAARQLFGQAVDWAIGPDACDPCDINCDGDISAFDIEPFLELLFNGEIPCDTCTGDINRDGRIDAFDIEPFLTCLFP